MSGINEITSYLIEESNSKAEAMLQKAELSAKAIIDQQREKGEKEKASILKNYCKRVKEIENAEVLRINMERQKEILLAKQSLIDDVLEKVRVKFENQSIEDWIDFIKRLLEKAETETETAKPVICVSKEYYPKVKEAFLGEYETEIYDIKNGFILSYETYDLNYEVDHFLHYEREEMEILTSKLLFNGESYE